MQKRHRRILFRALQRDRVREMHREPKVPEAEVPPVECLDGLARITSEELATIHSVKMAPSRMLVLQVREWMQIWGKVLLCTSPG